MRPSGMVASSFLSNARSFIIPVLIGVATAPDADDEDVVRRELDAGGCV